MLEPATRRLPRRAGQLLYLHSKVVSSIMGFLMRLSRDKGAVNGEQGDKPVVWCREGVEAKEFSPSLCSGCLCAGVAHWGPYGCMISGSVCLCRRPGSLRNVKMAVGGSSSPGTVQYVEREPFSSSTEGLKFRAKLKFCSCKAHRILLDSIAWKTLMCHRPIQPPVSMSMRAIGSFG